MKHKKTLREKQQILAVSQLSPRLENWQGAGCITSDTSRDDRKISRIDGDRKRVQPMET